MGQAINKGRRNGFTLIEILIVLAIVMVMMSMAIFAFVDFGRGAKMRSSMLNFRSAFNHARQHAITHRTRTHLIYGNRYPEPGYPERGYYVLSNATDGIMGSTNFMPEGVVFSNEASITAMHPWSFEFKLDGTCEDIPDVKDWVSHRRKVIIVEGGRGGNYLVNTVEVFRLTGTIQRQE